MQWYKSLQIGVLIHNWKHIATTNWRIRIQTSMKGDSMTNGNVKAIFYGIIRYECVMEVKIFIWYYLLYLDTIIKRGLITLETVFDNDLFEKK